MQGCVGLGLAVLLAAPAQAGSDDPAAGLSAEQIEKIVHDYLLREPEVVYQALQELQRRQEAAKAEHQKAAVAANHAELFQHADDPVGGNPDGDVTVVEFFDYQCAYCRRVMPSLQAQLRGGQEAQGRVQGLPDPRRGLGDRGAGGARGAQAGPLPAVPFRPDGRQRSVARRHHGGRQERRHRYRSAWPPT